MSDLNHGFNISNGIAATKDIIRAGKDHQKYTFCTK